MICQMILNLLCSLYLVKAEQARPELEAGNPDNITSIKWTNNVIW